MSMMLGQWSIGPIDKRKAKRERRLHREPIVRRIADILACAVSSKFEYEASCRHGLRAALCLQGQSWRDADKFAAAVVELALHRIGAARPSWAQGQPEAIDRVVEHYYCQICGRPIPEGRKFRFCSDECRKIAKNRRNEANHRDIVEVARLAFHAARAKGEALTRTCAHCGGEFQIKSGRHTELAQRYCGQDCAAAAVGKKTRRAPRQCKLCGGPLGRGQKLYCGPECQAAAIRKERVPRTCAHCGNDFRVRFEYQTNRYCSRACRFAALAAARPCAVCGGEFQPKNDYAIYCSDRCKSRAHKARKRANAFTCEAVE